MNTIKLNCENKPLMVAHRGCSGLERENTNAAFVAAGNRSYFGIETDVHKTLDGKYIIIHDDTTGRVAVDDMVVEKTTFDTLRKLTLRNKATHVKDRSDLVLPSLAEYIGICKYYEKEAVLELKNAFEEQDIYEICDIIEGLGYLEHTTFISFCYDNLVYLRRKHPTASAQYLIGKNCPMNWLDMLKKENLDLDVYHKVLTKEIVDKCHENGIKVNCWTVDKLEDAERVIACGVDMITSNILE
jgi:glycerophosphoryl diester phosphodiesterase